MAAVSKEEYLKRYLSGGDAEGKKKKKKKEKKEKEASSKKGNGIRVFEDDAFASVAAEDYHGMDSDEDIEIEMIQEAIKSKVTKGNMKGSFKSTFTSIGDEADIKKEPVDEDDSFYSSGMKQESQEQEQKVQITLGSNSARTEGHGSRRQRHDSDHSPPPLSRQRHDSDNSPVRSRRRHDSDNSPVRKRTRHDSDGSPPRRKAASPARGSRKQHDSDASPPRRKRNDSPDQSPPRRRKRHDSDASPPRRQRQASPDQSPPRRRQRHDSDASPPRNRRQASPSPPRRRQRRDSDQSPPRGGRRGSDSDQSPPRAKRRVASPTVEGHQKTLDGKVAGLQSAKALRDESDKLRAREAKMFEDLDTSVSGRNAETVVREKTVGKRKGKDSQEDKEKKDREAQKQAELQEKYKDWNRGMKQVQNRQEQLDEMARVVAGPMTRTKDDVDMNKYLKDVIHESDPMASFIKKNKKEAAIDRGDLVYPTYDKPFPPNRYGIRPGYRWDGVDRSNGFEAKLASSQNIRQAEEKEFYANMNTFD